MAADTPSPTPGRVGASPAPLAAAAARRPQASDGLVRLRDSISTYLPLLLMVLLALVTWWLVRNTPQATPVPTTRAVTHDADYTMRQALLQRFDNQGRLRVQVQGDRLRHFPDTDTLEVDTVRIQSYAPDGSVTVATANKAVTNTEASQVQLLGGAQVQRQATVTQEAMTFVGEFLQVDVDARRVRSHLPVTFQMGRNTVQAASFDYDDETQVAHLKGAVRAVVAPPTAKVR